jgi:hypothetical protein
MFIRDLADLRERVKIFLTRIPKSLLDILGFSEKATTGELQDFMTKAIKLMTEDPERHAKMDLQKKYGLPIHPNQSWHDLKIKIRIIELKKKKENEAQGKKDDNEFLKGGNDGEEV